MQLSKLCTVYECGWPPWTQHASTYTLRYVRTDFEFYMQQPVCMCSVSFCYNVSILQEFLTMQRVVSLARLLCNRRAEKQSGHMSQVTMAQGRETIQ